MNVPCTLLLASSLALTAISGCATDEKSKQLPAATTSDQPLAVEESIDVSVTATVKAIDYATRVVTLQDAAGHQETLAVGREVTRLNEVKTGDLVKARYMATLLAELRPPTAEETANPIAAVELAGRAARSDSPAAGVVEGIRVVTTVEAIDVPNMRVTLRGPMGDLAVVQGKKPENIKRLRVGDTIVITYAEAVAISLEKVAKR